MSDTASTTPLPIRVLGRIDRAELLHAALVAAGADALLVTTAPGAAIAATDQDGTSVDVLAGLEHCASIKKASSRRPVVVVTWEEFGGEAAQAAYLARTSSGPDAHLAWPATGQDLMAACARAIEGAARARPRFTGGQRVAIATGVAMACASAWALGVLISAWREGDLLARNPWASFTLDLLQSLFWAALASQWAWGWPGPLRFSAPSRWRWFAFWSAVALGVLSAMRVVLDLVRALA